MAQDNSARHDNWLGVMMMKNLRFTIYDLRLAVTLMGLLACCDVTAQSIIKPPSGTLRIMGHLVVTNTASGLATNIIQKLAAIEATGGGTPLDGSVTDAKLNLSAPTLGNPSATTLTSDEVESHAILYDRAQCVPFSLGTIAGGGTATLDIDFSCFTITTTGATWTLAVPTNQPNGNVIIDGTSTSDTEPQVVTLSNAAIRPELSASVATNKFTIPASSGAKYTIYLRISAGLIERFSVAGDEFTPPTPASIVTFAPTASISSVNVQNALGELDTEKAAILSLDDSAFDGDYAKLSATPQTMSQSEADAGLSTTPRLITAAVLGGVTATQSELQYASVYAAGTAYTLTATPALADFGTTDPSFSLTNSGIYRLDALANVRYVGATYAGSQTVTVKLRRTNNTAADITSATHTRDLEIVSTFTGPAGQLAIPPVYYSTVNNNDIVQLFASVSATPSAGSMTVDQASITSLRIAPFGVDVAAPTLVSATIDASGTNLTLVLSEIVTFGAGGNAGFVITPSGGAATVTYSSGSGTSSLLYTLGRVISQGETATLAYTQPGSGVEDATGNDLANFSGTAVTNNSTQSTEVQKQTIGADTANLAIFTASNQTYVGATFTTASAYHLTRVEAKLKKVSSPTGTISARLYATSAGAPTTLLATSSSTLDASQVNVSATIYSFDFSYDLANGVTYAIALSKDTTDGVNYIHWRDSTSGAYKRSTDGSTWVNVNGNTPYALFYGY